MTKPGNDFNTVAVVGLGYIGLPTAAVFAQHGQKVIGIDVNAKTVDVVNSGNIHIVEPGLKEVVAEAVDKGLLSASTTAQPAEAFLIAVPTPFTSDMQPDLTYVEAASRAIAPVLKKGDLVVLESTSPVGATETMAEWLAEQRADLSFPQQAGEDADVLIAHCPERVLPGKVLEELVENSRTIGGMSNASSKRAIELYEIFVKGECLTTNARTAEMTKLTENAFRDVNIAFANELSLICDKLDVDVWELIDMANHHPRVNILKPGPGVGGHCIAVDPWFIVAKSPQEARLIRTAREVNDGKPQWVLEQVAAMRDDFISSNDREPTIACYGLAFKPDIDDLRESPALAITQELAVQYGASVRIVEPNIDTPPTSLVDHEMLEGDEAAQSCDLHVLLVAHSQFHSIAGRFSSGSRVLDCCGLLHTNS